MATFTYLGSILSEDGRCEKEIRTRIGMAKANFGKMRNLLTNLSLDAQLRLRILECYIWSGLLYGCESWTLSADMKKKLKAAEMWFLRRMWRVPWTARRTNQEVLEMANTSRSLITIMRKRQLKYIGHVLRGQSLEKDCLLGMVEGSRARGRQRMKYMDGLKTLLGCESIEKVARLAEGREDWRKIVAHVNEDTALR